MKPQVSHDEPRHGRVKVTSMRDAVADVIHDGDVVAIEGFTHLISFAAGHEIIRQRKRDLTLARLTPDLMYGQIVAAGTARKLIFSWLGNPASAGYTPFAAASRPRIRLRWNWRNTATSAWSAGPRPARRTCPSSHCARTSNRTCPRRIR